jgi:23S rRNA pseudouridine1911/1915/1917 synthase
MHKNFKENIIIPEALHKQRLDQALAQLLPQFSRTQLQTWILQGDILVNGKPSKNKAKVATNDHIKIEVSLNEAGDWEAQKIPLDIVYEDEHLLVINKAVGLVVHPGAGNKDQTLLNALLYHAPHLRLLPRAGILHRLDKDTSGLLLIAKDALALKNLQQQLKKRRIVRGYKAIVQGIVISGGSVTAAIGRHPLQRKKMAVVETGKPACTHYRVAKKYRAHTLLNVQLETGRTHQIRVHMLHLHHPIVGDKTYTYKTRLAKNISRSLIEGLQQFKRQALHAYALSFTHPISQAILSFTAPMPQDMQDLLHLMQQDLQENS